MYDETHGDEPQLTGSLLLAHPHLKDPNFSASVVLLTRHEEEGSLGVVLNRSTGQRLGELDASFESCGLGAVPVYEGGPVNNNQIILAAWKFERDAGQFHLYFGMEPEAARNKMLMDQELEFRAFKGYAGWSEGQLLGELEDNAWVVSDVDADSLASRQGADLWRHLITEVNPELGLLALVPENPDAN